MLLLGPQALMVPPSQTGAPDPLPSPFQALFSCRHGGRGAWGSSLGFCTKAPAERNGRE